MHGYLRDEGPLLCPTCGGGDLYRHTAPPTHLTCQSCLQVFHEDEAEIDEEGE